MIQVNCTLKSSPYSSKDDCYYITFKSEVLALPGDVTRFSFRCNNLTEGLSWINLDEFENIQTKSYEDTGQTN